MTSTRTLGNCSISKCIVVAISCVSLYCVGLTQGRHHSAGVDPHHAIHASRRWLRQSSRRKRGHPGRSPIAARTCGFLAGGFGLPQTSDAWHRTRIRRVASVSPCRSCSRGNTDEGHARIIVIVHAAVPSVLPALPCPLPLACPSGTLPLVRCSGVSPCLLRARLTPKKW